MRYQFLSSMPLNEVQKQYQRAKEQAGIIEAQQKQIDQLQERLLRIENMLNSDPATARATLLSRSCSRTLLAANRTKAQSIAL